ncbi:MAG TPA: calcium/proton exchanger [Planctomycetota bacterium]|nr:calcium/proton exchanger [Planctomycetota bacterium]
MSPRILANLSKLDLLLVFVPLGLYLDHTGADKAWVFVACAIAIIPLAGIIGRATEQLSERSGPGIGGLLNATFGNATELIVAIVALKQGKATLVQASLTGSIIGNLLFVFGLSAFVGGLRREKQTLNATVASVGNSSLHLAVIGMVFPSVLFSATDRGLEGLSKVIATVLLVLYGLGLWFSLKTHRHLFAEEETMAAADLPAEESLKRGGDEPPWPLPAAIVVLLVASVVVGIVSESLVGAVERAIERFHMPELFVGAVILAIVGNAAEHSTAVLMAHKGKIALAHSIAAESAKQIALFVTPLCVLLGAVLVPAGATPMTLHFSPTEVAAAYVSVLISTQILADGETTWLEGAQLLGLYAVVAATFYFVG